MGSSISLVKKLQILKIMKKNDIFKYVIFRIYKKLLCKEFGMEKKIKQ